LSRSPKKLPLNLVAASCVTVIGLHLDVAASVVALHRESESAIRLALTKPNPTRRIKVFRQ
jgi:hypothetical protein